VLALDVLLYHCWAIWQAQPVFVFALRLNPMASIISFLLISGYSIAHSITREEHNFFKRRLRRIYPTYFLCLSVAVLAFCTVGIPQAPWMQRHTLSLYGVAGHFVFAQPFFTQSMSNFGPSWNLGVEVLFYMLAPLLLRMRGRFILAMALASAVLYAWYPFNDLLPDARGAIAPATLAWAWLLGWLIYRFPQPNIRPLLVLPALLLPAILVMLQPQLVDKPHYSPWMMVLPLVTVFWLVFPTPLVLSPRTRKVLNYLGDLSYPLYLIHWPVICALTSLGLALPSTSPWFALCGSCLAAAVILQLARMLAPRATHHPLPATPDLPGLSQANAPR